MDIKERIANRDIINKHLDCMVRKLDEQIQIENGSKEDLFEGETNMAGHPKREFILQGFTEAEMRTIQLMIKSWKI